MFDGLEVIAQVAWTCYWRTNMRDDKLILACGAIGVHYAFKYLNDKSNMVEARIEEYKEDKKLQRELAVKRQKDEENSSILREVVMKTRGY